MNGEVNRAPDAAAGRLPGPGDEPDTAIAPLACGRDAAAVWDHATAGTLDEHERGCPHCAAAIADARRLDGVVHRMAAEPLTPPPSVMERVMGAVLAELRPYDVISLASPHGPARLSRPAAAAVLRHVVDGMGGVHARSCRIEQVEQAGDVPHISGGPAAAVTVAMTVTARFGVDLASVAARVRQMVIAAAGQALGVPVQRVDIEVVDVFDDRGQW
ncbi:Asp23/Gls24 family envelope stress response protein [Pseudonocardia acidicola]|uniref:Asp23/Gls24 family envelope stress response protein n=1 Tax=Pseudonocardia acidicola TaxID=2724939 RepID=UPI001EF07456|nr:Asp23/Gls24 family envelope stress response protein [Pseudonocardia acidicola]